MGGISKGSRELPLFIWACPQIGECSMLEVFFFISELAWIQDVVFQDSG